ncbi:MAG: TiaS agmantine-binding domain-containing protein [Candidatus Methanomethylicaceae archaeon]
MDLYHLGIDDTDSLKYGCTTYIAALLVENLLKDSTFADYPNLIRLNPNIPWKSRGNAGICLRFYSYRNGEDILDLTLEYVEKYRDQMDEKNQPGIALLKGEVPQHFKDFGRRALYEVLTIEEAQSLAKMANVKYRIIRGGRGLIGALAAIGNTLDEDHTFELVVYRRKELWEEERRVNFESVVRFDQETKPFTFNNIDYDAKRLLITPHGTDPILFGVRGETPGIVKKALNIIKFEGGERWIIYRSNQGTEAHLTQLRKIRDLKEYQAAVVEGTISNKPIVLKGGHVIATLNDGSGEIDMAGYEPSGEFRMVVKALMPGDRIRAYGGIRLLEGGKLTFNLEKLQILNLIREKYTNPVCPTCHKSMKSEGKGKGYQCKKCGAKVREPILVKFERKINEGLYLPPPRSMRHLTKPLQRYGLEKKRWDGRIEKFYGTL